MDPTAQYQGYPAPAASGQAPAWAGSARSHLSSAWAGQSEGSPDLQYLDQNYYAPQAPADPQAGPSGYGGAAPVPPAYPGQPVYNSAQYGAQPAYQPGYGAPTGMPPAPMGAPMGAGAPSFFSNPLGMFSTVAHMGQNMQAGQSYVQTQMSWFTGSLFQRHFQVDPIYAHAGLMLTGLMLTGRVLTGQRCAVRKKLLLLLAPYLGMYDYVRATESMNGHTVVMKPPRCDLYAPDLYIPLLSMLTYCVMVAITKFLNRQFTVDVMYSSFTWASVAWLFNFGIMWTLTKGMGMARPPSKLDLCAYSGYAFVGYCVSMLVGWTGGRALAWYAAWMYTSLCTGCFLVRTFKQTIRLDAAHGGVAAGAGVMYPLLMLGLAQFATAWVMGTTVHRHGLHHAVQAVVESDLATAGPMTG